LGNLTQMRSKDAPADLGTTDFVDENM